jgi:hypothetical protein
MGIYRCVSNTCQYQAPAELDASEWKGWIFAALIEVVKEQPFMRVGLADEDKHASYFVYLLSIDLEKQVECQPITGDEEECDRKILKLLETRHDSIWPGLAKRPPWKVTIMLRTLDGQKTSRADISYSFHHSIGDGTSGKIFHERLLQSLRRHEPPTRQQAGVESVLHFSEPPTLPPPQESIVDLTISWRYCLSALWKEYRPSFLAPKRVYPWAGAPIQFDTPYITKIHLVQVDKTTRDKLLTVCRMHSTTLTGLLMALVLVSAVRQLPEESNFVSNMPISLRPYVKKDARFNVDKSFHILVTALMHEFGPDVVQDLHRLLDTGGSDQTLDDKVWELAKRVRSDIARKKQQLPADDIMGLMGWIPDMHPWLLKKDGQPREWTWEVSNVGILKDEGDNKSGIHIRRMIFSQSSMVTGAAFGVSVAGCNGDEALTLTISYQQDVVTPGLIETLKGDLEMWFTNLAGTGRLGWEP